MAALAVRAYTLACVPVAVAVRWPQIFVSYLQVLTLIRKVPLEFPAFLMAMLKTSNQASGRGPRLRTAALRAPRRAAQPCPANDTM